MCKIISADVAFFFLCDSKAKLLLRKKKFQESMLQKTDGQLENIERMVKYFAMVFEPGTFTALLKT